MKKLLVLALVLSMASMASATLQITSSDAVVSSATITPTGTLSLGIDAGSTITAGAGWPGTGDNFYWVLACDTTLGSINWETSGVVLPADSGLAILSSASNSDVSAANAGWAIPAGTDGAFGSLTLFTLTSIAAGTQIFDNIAYAASAAGTQTLSLYETDGNIYNMVSSVVVHQIPEPITMALLGLGGLFLRRRK